MELANKPTKVLGTRHWQILLVFSADLLGSGMRSMMSIAVVAMTDTKSKHSDAPTFDWTGNQKSLLLSCVLWGSAAAQLPFGLAIMRLDVKRLLTISMLSSGVICTLIPTLATKTGWLPTLVCSAIIGLGVSTVDPSLQSLVSRWTPLSERSRFGTFAVSGSNIGTIVSMFLGGQIAASTIGWPGIFYMYGLIAVIWAILFHFLSANAPSEHPRISPEERNYIESNQGSLTNVNEKKNLTFPWKSVVKSVPVWAVMIAICGHCGNYYVLNTQLPNFMKNALDFNIDQAGGVSALPYLVRLLLSFPISWLSDVALQRGVRVGVIRKVASTIGMWGPAAMLLVLCLTKTTDRTVVVAIMTLCVGLNCGALAGIVLNCMDLTPNFSGTVYSAVHTIGMLCGITAPIVANAIVTDNKSGDQWYLLFYMSIVIYILTNLIFIIFGKAEEQPWNDPNHSLDKKVPENLPPHEIIENIQYNIPAEERRISGPAEKRRVSGPCIEMPLSYE